jgi:sugar O-acyltransferase (sialic acid O-acetyltransferase NeuD family)
MKNIVIYGAGGLGIEVENIIKRLNATKSERDRYNIVGYITTHGDGDSDMVIGDENILLEQPELNVVLAIGSPMARLSIGKRLLQSIGRSRMPCIIDPSVIIDHSTLSIGAGAIVAQNVVGTVNVCLGDFCYINLSCTIGHGASIGFGSVVNPGVNISGDVDVGAGVLVGTGATILEKLMIFDHSIVGGGSVVTKSVNSAMTVVGVPAKELVRKK